ncbi:MAG TPA: hypothetical protein DCE41_26500, partial [Cytophagales bacterium]|nr:hypothetical protein [Cytophagales bacterium]
MLVQHVAKSIPLMKSTGLFVLLLSSLCSCTVILCQPYEGEPYIALRASDPSTSLDSVLVYVSPDEPVYTYDLQSVDEDLKLISMPMHYEEVQLTVYSAGDSSQIDLAYAIEVVDGSEFCNTGVRLLPTSITAVGNFQTVNLSEEVMEVPLEENSV